MTKKRLQCSRVIHIDQFLFSEIIGGNSYPTAELVFATFQVLSGS